MRIVFRVPFLSSVIYVSLFECEDFVRCFGENSETIEHHVTAVPTAMSIIEEQLLSVDSKISNLFLLFSNFKDTVEIGRRGVKIPYLPYGMYL